jgi:uncharacterized protein (DUF2336 family)
MSAAQAPLIPELEEALGHIASDKQGEIVRRFTDLFVAGAASFNELHVRLFDRILSRLIVGLEVPELTQVARRLAPVPNAPPDLIRHLAGHHDIAVAGPVLMRSPCLAEEDLIEVAGARDQAHLFAISGRAGVGEGVTDALIERGDRDVARNLAMNAQATLSERGLAKLAQRAASDAVLAEKLVHRADVTRETIHSLVAAAGTENRARLIAVLSAELRADVEAALAPVPQHVADVEAEIEARRFVRVLHQGGRLTEARVLEFAESGREKETVAALALICDMSVDGVRRLIAGDEPDAALVLCQAAGFGWETALAILTATGWTDWSSAAQAKAELTRLSCETAGQIVGLWRTCQHEWRAAS